MTILAAAVLAVPTFGSIGTMTVEASSQRMRDLEQQQQELKSKSNNLDEEIKNKDQEMNSLEEEKQQLEKEVTALQGNIDELIKNISEKEDDIKRIEKEIERLNKEIEQLKHQIEQRNEQLEAQARSVQVNGNPADIVDVLMSAENLSELIGRIGLVNKLVSANQKTMEAQVEDRLALEDMEKRVQGEHEEVKLVKEQLEVDRNNLVAQRMELDDKIIQVAEKYNMTADEKASFINEQAIVAERTSTLDKEMQKEQKRIVEEARREAEQKRLAEEKRKKEEEEKARVAAEKARQQATAKKTTQESSTSTSSSNSSSSSSSSSQSGWIRPANGRLSSRFGYRKHPIHGDQRLHAGIDIAGGGPIRAAKGGVVRTASYHNSFGYHVIIDHGGGMSTLYAHLQPGLNVAPGQNVSQGQQLGIMGTTGSSTGVHLHFEVHINGSPVDPIPYIGG